MLFAEMSRLEKSWRLLCRAIRFPGYDDLQAIRKRFLSRSVPK